MLTPARSCSCRKATSSQRLGIVVGGTQEVELPARSTCSAVVGRKSVGHSVVYNPRSEVITRVCLARIAVAGAGHVDVRRDVVHGSIGIRRNSPLAGQLQLGLQQSQKRVDHPVVVPGEGHTPGEPGGVRRARAMVLPLHDELEELELLVFPLEEELELLVLPLEELDVPLLE